MEVKEAQQADTVRIDKICQSIAKRYQIKCEEDGVSTNTALLAYLQTPRKDTKFGFDVVFRGNDKYHFTNRLRDSDLIAFCNAMSEWADIVTHLDFSYNLLTNESMKALCDFLIRAKGLLSLNLQYNSIGTEGIVSMTAGLLLGQQENGGSLALEYLNIEGNEAGTLGIKKLTKILQKNFHLRHLFIGNNKYDHDAVIKVCKVLNSNTNECAVEVLGFDHALYHSTMQETSIHFGKMLRANNKLQRLSIRKHSLDDAGIYIIFEHILRNNKLQVLDLSANLIRAEGCKVIGKYLKGDYCAMESFNLSNNKIGYHGAKILAEAIPLNRSLVHLDLTTNDITDDGLKFIGESIVKNDTLNSVKLYWNHFDQGALRVFHKIVEDSKIRGARGKYWFFDFVTIEHESEIEMAYIENNIPRDVGVAKPYFDS